MLEITYLREHAQEAAAGLKKRGLDAEQSIQDILKLDELRRQNQNDLDQALAESNHISKEIGLLYKEGKRDEADKAKARTAELKDRIKELQQEQEQLKNSLEQDLVALPNVPIDIVPAGKSEADNEEVKRVGEIKAMPEGAKPHWELAEELKLIRFDLGVKITGAGFPVYQGKGARLQRALINFFLEENRNAGFEEYQPPLMVNEDSGFGTGQLPDKEGQMYHVTEDKLYAIPTAEVPITNIFRGDIIEDEDLPIKATAYSACFRREAGSYGKDVRGLNRLHQFDKVEIVCLTKPEDSMPMLDSMVEHVAGLLEKLELPYRILRLCGGDMGFTSAITYDFEVWSAAQERWLEVSSVSNFKTFQTNRMKIRYRGEDKKTQLLHSLNGSALALPRIVAALLENHQGEDGIRIPEALQAFTGFDKI
ncbi:serine--tRNA ligase [Croceimicrobium sp.]|uniref:serine--tRNA ligase n=1 Tax=Croceimicrobium sp. TaxID=2828340 RepID=UPI003BACC2DC